MFRENIRLLVLPYVENHEAEGQAKIGPTRNVLGEDIALLP